MPYPLYFVNGKVGLLKRQPAADLDIEGTVSATEYVTAEEGDVGNQTDPSFKFVIQNAGIDEPEYALFYRDADHPSWRKVAGTESTGTHAAVRDDWGSHFEGFDWDGVSVPAFRLNSYPRMQLQLGSNAKADAGDMSRTTDVVTVTTTHAHGFSQGQNVELASSQTNFASGTKAVASVPDAVTFTYSESGSDAVSTDPAYFSEDPSVSVGRAAYRHLGLYVNDERKVSVYLDSVTTEDGIRFATAGSLECSKITATTTTPYTLAVEYGLLVDATAGAKVVNLPAASSCKGRQYLIKKTDNSANTVTVTRAGSDTIEGSNTAALTAQYDYVKLISDGVATWFIESAVIT